MTPYRSSHSRSRALPRRTFLKAAGVSLSLPWLTAMRPAAAADEEAAPHLEMDPVVEAGEGPPRRFVAMTLGLGLLSENLYPTESGRGWAPSRYLEPLEDLRDQLTVVSGSSHPDVKGGHRAEAAILTCNPYGASGKASNTISLDQYLAKYLGDQTRFPSLVLGSSSSSSPCYTESGSMIAAETSPRRLFMDLFVDAGAAERKKQADRIRSGRSIMDLVMDDAKRLRREVGPGDSRRLDEYFSSVRDLEVRMRQNEAWAKRPKPSVEAELPVDISSAADFIGRQRLMCSVIKLALETDSTRYVAYHLGSGNGVLPLDGVEEGYHTLSHHGLDDGKLEQLALVEGGIIAAMGEFLRELREVNESGRSLLESTSVLLTSNLGNASNHSNKNMPVVLAGGGFRHGQHLAFDQKNNYPLPNLFVSLLQRHGLQTDRFYSGTGTMDGLELA